MIDTPWKTRTDEVLLAVNYLQNVANTAPAPQLSSNQKCSMPYDRPLKSPPSTVMFTGYQEGKGGSRLPAEPPVTHPISFHPVESFDLET